MTATIKGTEVTDPAQLTPNGIAGLEFTSKRKLFNPGEDWYDATEVDDVIDLLEERVATLMREREEARARVDEAWIRGQIPGDTEPLGDVKLPPLVDAPPPDVDEAGLLTFTERRAVEALAELWGLLSQIVAPGRNQRDDLAELVPYVHALQNAVLAQAAARAYPDRYRLLGLSVGDEHPDPSLNQEGERCV